MTVLSEPVKGSRDTGGGLCVAVSADDATIQSRIAAVLAQSGEVETQLTVAPPYEQIDLEIDPEAIVVLACDPDLPAEMAGLRRARRELHSRPIIVVSPDATGAGVRRALDAGADAIVFEADLESTLGVAVRAVASGQSVVPRKLRASVERPTFSHRERQVLEYVTKGLTNAQIAKRLFLSESTIKSHLSSAFAKLGVRSRKEAAALFLELEAMAYPGEPSEPRYVLAEPSQSGATA